MRNVTQYPTSSPNSEATTTQSVRLSLERRGRDVAALVSLEDLALLNDLEDRIDLEAAREAVEEYGSVGGEEVKSDLGSDQDRGPYRGVAGRRDISDDEDLATPPGSLQS